MNSIDMESRDVPCTDVEPRVVRVIAECLHCDSALVTPDKAIVEDLGADFLHPMEVSVALEDEFDIELSDVEPAEITTVQHAIDIVVAHAPSS